VAADLTEDTSHVHAPSQSSRFSITSTALLAQSRSAPLVHSDGSGKRLVLFDDAKEGGKPRLTIGKRKSFVGTVRACFPHDFTYEITYDFISHAGWLRNLFKGGSTTLQLISGALVLQRWSCLKVGRRDPGSPLSVCC